MHHDYLFRFILVGDYSVGKTHLISRFVDQHPPEGLISPVVLDFRFKTIHTLNKTIKLQIWDTTSQERFHAVSPNYYKKANAVLLVYDITSLESFEDLQSYWIKEVETHAGTGLQIALIGNKSDLRHIQAVPTEQAAAFANEKGMIFLEASAKTGENVQNCLQILTERVMQELENSQGKAEQLKRIDLRSQIIGRGSRAGSSCC